MFPKTKNWKNRLLYHNWPGIWKSQLKIEEMQIWGKKVYLYYISIIINIFFKEVGFASALSDKAEFPQTAGALR